jgi:hypothetical protein
MEFSAPKWLKQAQNGDFEAFFIKNGICKPFQRRKIAKTLIYDPIFSWFPWHVPIPPHFLPACQSQYIIS